MERWRVWFYSENQGTTYRDFKSEIAKDIFVNSMPNFIQLISVRLETR